MEIDASIFLDMDADLHGAPNFENDNPFWFLVSSDEKIVTFCA